MAALLSRSYCAHTRCCEALMTGETTRLQSQALAALAQVPLPLVCRAGRPACWAQLAMLLAAAAVPWLVAHRLSDRPAAGRRSGSALTRAMLRRGSHPQPLQPRSLQRRQQLRQVPPRPRLQAAQAQALVQAQDRLPLLLLVVAAGMACLQWSPSPSRAFGLGHWRWMSASRCPHSLAPLLQKRHASDVSLKMPTLTGPVAVPDGAPR